MGKLALVLVGAVLTGIVLAHTHSHEAPHSKYGREINEQAAQEAAAGQHAHAHGHSHEGGKCPYSHGSEPESHGHAHAHDDHGHSHETADSHGHAHEDHGHSHEDHGHSHEAYGHAHAHSATKREAVQNDVKYEGFLSFMNDPKTRIWVHAIGATLLISAAPCFILMFIPIQTHNAESDPLLKVLLAFGSGGLLGDAFLHLIPHATPADSGHAHSHSHSEAGHGHTHDNSVGGWVLGGIIAFLVVEKLVRILRGGEGHSHSHGHSHDKKSAKNSDDESEKKKDDKSSKTKAAEPKQEEGIKVAAYLNLVADFTHNFTDGLAIGASFLAGPTVGFVTMLTVLVHEVPHEIGDFAILIQSGYTKYKAMGIQLVTALGALSGCVLSLWVADNGDLADAAAHSWVLPFTAGGFIYIATVSVIPELLENSSTWQSIKEICALLLGIYLMYLIALYE